jgi:hypothetical protein
MPNRILKLFRTKEQHKSILSLPDLVTTDSINEIRRIIDKYKWDEVKSAIFTSIKISSNIKGFIAFAVNCYNDLSCTFRLELGNFVVSNIFEENKIFLLCVDCIISLIYLMLGLGKPIDQLINLTRSKINFSCMAKFIIKTHEINISKSNLTKSQIAPLIVVISEFCKLLIFKFGDGICGLSSIYILLFIYLLLDIESINLLDDLVLLLSSSKTCFSSNYFESYSTDVII